MGVEDVIGQQAQNAASQVEQLLGALGASILGITLEELTALGTTLEHALQTFFSGLLGFLGGLNPLNPLFSIVDAANRFVQNILLNTQGLIDFIFLLGNPLGIGTGNLILPTDLSQIPILAPVLTLLETVGAGFDQLLTLLGLPTPEAVVAYLEGFAPIAAIISALSGVGSGLSGLLAALSEIPGGNIAGALNTAVTVAGKAIGTIVTNIDAAGNLLAAGITGGLTSAVTIGSHAITTLLQYLDSLGRFDATHLVGDLVNSLTYGGTALSTFFQNIDSSGGLLAAGVTGGLTSAVTVAGTAITTLVTNIDAAGNFAVTALSGLGSGVLTFLQATLAGAAATFLGAGTLPYTLLTGLGSGISTFLGGSISAIAQTLASSGTLAVTALSGLGSGVLTFLQATLAGAAATFLGAGTLPYTLLTGLGSGVLTFLGAALAGAAATFLVAGVLPFALLSGLDSSVSSFLAGIVSPNAQTLATGGTLTGTALTGAINTAVTISGNAISTLFNSSGALASALTGALNTSVTIFGNAISALFNSSGVLAAALTGAINTAVTISGNAISTLFSGSGVLASALTGAINTAVTISGNPISALFSAGGVLGSAIAGATAIEQSLIDTAVGTGNAGFPFTFPMSFGAVANDIADVGTAILDASHSAQDVLNTIVQSITGVQTNVDHSLQDLSTAIAQLPATLPVAVTSVADTAVHTASTTASQITALVTNSLTADAAAAGAALATVNTNMSTIIGGVSGTVAADVSTAITTTQAAAQATINNIFNAVYATNTVVDQAVASVQTGLSSFFTGLFNGWTGQSWSTASAADVVQTAAPAAKTITDAHTVSISNIQAELPSYYGGGGAGGLLKSVSMAGTLPAGFSSASTIAVASAMYNTVATTDTHTVVGAWSLADTHAQYLFLRGNAAFDTMVYAKIQANTPFTGTGNCEIGCVVSGVRHVFSTFALPGNFIAGSAYFFSAVSSTFTLSGPGGLNATYTDGGVSQVGSSYRYGGFGTDGYIREIDTWTAAGTTSYNPPAWMQATDSFDFVEVGGGGGGGGVSSSYGFAAGGVCGAWNTATLVRSTVGGSITLTVGAGGAAGPGGGSGGVGGASALVVPGYGTITGDGGAGGASVSSGSPSVAYGVSPGNTTLSNTGYYGGATQTAIGYAGNSPGGGGTGGWLDLATFTGANATAGAPGAVWITANDRSCPGSLGYWAIFDAAVSGPTETYVATGETTTSASYTDLATTTDQVTVNIGSSAMALVYIDVGLAFNPNTNGRADVSFAVSGATTLAAGNYVAIQQSNSATQLSAVALCGAYLVPNLNVGATTFKMKYSADANGGTASFYFRRIAVIPL